MPYVHFTKPELEALNTLCQHDENPLSFTKEVLSAQKKIQAAKLPRRHFTLDFEMNTPAFDGSRTAAGVLEVLGKVSGLLGNSQPKWSGVVHDKDNQLIGSYEISWVNDPKPEQQAGSASKTRRR